MAYKAKHALLLLILSLTLASCHSSHNKTIKVRHPWAGKKVGFIGDSMTDPDCYGKETVKYWYFLQKWLKITPCVSAVSGRQWSELPALANNLYNKYGTELDAIIVFLGTNDFNAAVPLGEWFSEEEAETPRAYKGDTVSIIKRVQRVPNFNEETFKGRINAGIYILKALWPDKQIVLLTPLHRSTAVFGITNYQPNENFQNECGEYLDAYVEAIKEAGNIWGVPVIDIHSLVGINPFVQEQVAYYRNADSDLLHLSTKGHKRLAKTLVQQLVSLPVEFDDEHSR